MSTAPTNALRLDIRCVLLLLVIVIAAQPALVQGVERHALLIGIEDYRDSDFIPLKGPSNDLALVREVSQTRFDIPEAHIHSLQDQQATHSGIRQAFAELTQRVEPGDFVYIHYSGHGSVAEDKNDDEANGQDQKTWVSYGARAGKLEGDDDDDVIDDEIDAWLRPLYAKTDQVVFVSDSCHSATVSRGELTGVRAAPMDRRPHPLAAQRLAASPLLQGLRIGAARDHETAGEFTDDQDQTYGLFTWYWVQALNQARPGCTTLAISTRLSIASPKRCRPTRRPWS